WAATESVSCEATESFLVSAGDAHESLIPGSLLLVDSDTRGEDPAAQPSVATTQNAIDPTDENQWPWRFGPFNFDYLRGYVGLRLGLAAPAQRMITSELELGGPSIDIDGLIGVDLGPHIGFELAFDYFEYSIRMAGLGTIGEYATYTLIPQLRLRYPLLHDRVVPYFIAGAGVGITEFNDPRPTGGMAPVFAFGDKSSLAGSLGAGIDYFIAPNLALGVEAKRIFLSGELNNPGVEVLDTDLDSWLMVAGFRLYFPETPPSSMFNGLSWPEADRYGLQPYFSFHFGNNFFLKKSVTPDLKIGNESKQLSGGSVGLNINRYLGAELVVDNYDTHIESGDGLKLAEFAIWNIIPELRVRYPVLNGDLVPYMVAGVGAGFGQINDTTLDTGPGTRITLSGRDWSPVAAAGLGVDYFVFKNVAITAESKYVYQESTFQVNGKGQDVNVSNILVGLGLRIFLR
ncbi:MAG: porin family protein, partial [Gammaproteobacteria bacterium]|nr:porin family protein [Gammaproteobacteria bacterium]